MHSYQTYNFASSFCARKLSRPMTLQPFVAIAMCRRTCFPPQIVLLQYKAKPYPGFQNLGCHSKIWGCHSDTQKRLKKHCPCVRFSDYGFCHKFIKMRATSFLSFSCWNEFFYDCKRLVYRWTKETFTKLTAYRLALIHSTCSSTRQSELKVTHENTPTALPRFKNVIFRHHYVMQKNNGNGLLFHMTQPISRSTIKAIACSKPTISEN